MFGAQVGGAEKVTGAKSGIATALRANARLAVTAEPNKSTVQDFDAITRAATQGLNAYTSIESANARNTYIKMKTTPEYAAAAPEARNNMIKEILTQEDNSNVFNKSFTEYASGDMYTQ